MALVSSDVHSPPYIEIEQDDSQAYEYCSECCEKIFHWKRLGQWSTYTDTLHRDLADLIACAKHCKLCRYICDSFGELLLIDLSSQVVAGPALQMTLCLDSGNSPINPTGLLEHVVLRVSVWRRGTDISARRDFVVYTDVGRAIRRAIWNETHTVAFDTRVDTIRKWLIECREQHPRCRKSLGENSPLGSRILEVESSIHRQISVKLVETDSIDLHSKPYIVLSHVWGEIGINCKTILSNLHQYQIDIPLNTLPKTFRDAIQICAALDISYLWIDCLCIVQDSTQDWHCESAKMASIYRGASLTISATSSEDSTGGCSVSSTLEPATTFAATPKSKMAFSVRGPEYVGMQKRLLDDMSDAPVTKRAWIFQEKILSRRILHAARSQFVWQCATHTESEDGIHYQKGDRGSHLTNWAILDTHVIGELQNPASYPENYQYILDRRWWSWAADYMGRDLRYLSDQYAAFAGVVNLQEEMSGDEPVIGLWKKNLPIHLAWKANFEDDIASQSDLAILIPRDRRPSWTWMSYPHGSVKISSPLLEWEALKPRAADDSFGINYQAEVLHYTVNWSGEPHTSTPSGSIIIRGVCDRIEPLPRAHGRQGSVKYLDPGTSVEKGQKEFDVVVLLSYTQKGYLLNSKSTVTTVYLAITPVPSRNNDEYVRVGVIRAVRDIEANEDPKCQPKGAYKTITLL